MIPVRFVLLSLVLLGANAHADYIVGGNAVGHDDPVSGSVIALYQEQGNSGALCSATLISQDIAVTAAHCVEAGIQNMVAVFGSDIREEGARSIAVTNVEISPLWRKGRGTEKDQGDIALIRLAENAPKGFRRSPMVSAKTKLDPGEELMIAGYGISDAEASEGAGTLRETTLEIADPSFGETEMLLDQSQGSGACHGDSGGPAFVVKSGKLYLAGVTNRAYPDNAADDCAHEVVYTKISAYRSWIQSTMRSLQSGTRR